MRFHTWRLCFQVNAHQWGKLQGREDVRLVDRDRASRTIIASYKNAHSTFCEFVADEEESKAVAAGTLPMLSQPPRFFTPREVARLQGFPDGFELGEKDEASYSGVGNAVSVPVVAAIARAVVEAVAESTS